MVWPIRICQDRTRILRTKVDDLFGRINKELQQMIRIRCFRGGLSCRLSRIPARVSPLQLGCRLGRQAMLSAGTLMSGGRQLVGG